MFANCQLGGLDLAAPDVCLTPPVPIPIPYVNLAFGITAIPNVLHIMFSGMFAHNLGTIIPVTTGDEPGVAGGVASGTVKGLSRHITFVSNILVAGLPATKMTNLSLQNTTNIVGLRILPSQLQVLMAG